MISLLEGLTEIIKYIIIGILMILLMIFLFFEIIVSQPFIFLCNDIKSFILKHINKIHGRYMPDKQ